MNTKSKKEIAMAYLEAYKKAEEADLAYTKAIKDQFGENKTRWDFPGRKREFSAETMLAYMEKIDADHLCSKLLYTMREIGGSLEDMNLTENI